MSVPADRPLRVAITTLGCKVNFAEMAELAGTLAAGGCDVVREDEPADVRVLNSCTVTLQADATTRQRLRRLRALDPSAHLVVTGCSVDTNLEQFMPRATPGSASGALRQGSAAAPQRRPGQGIDAVFTNAHKHEIAGHILALAPARPTAVPSGIAGRSRAFLKLQDGCDHRCTYCIVWQARGRSVSVPTETVLQQAEQAVARGQQELVLTGVDLGAYGRDSGTTLAALLERLLDAVGDRARVRLSSVNANHVTRQLIELNAHPRLCSHWHMPLQSGSDTVLRAMHRGYRSAQYLRVVASLRERDPRTEFTTDVMVAFPGQREQDHADTLSLVEQVGFLACHVFRWSPRPGTPATEYAGRVDDHTARRRSAEVRRAAAATGMRSLQGAVGRVHEVVWDRVEAGAAHGLTAGYHDAVADAAPGITPGRLSQVIAESTSGGGLRVRVLP